jgi:protein-disulfide isomerase/uncharacterized membrane protein
MKTLSSREIIAFIKYIPWQFNKSFGVNSVTLIFPSEIYFCRLVPFSKGCFGISQETKKKVNLPCREVTQSPAGKIFGINSIIPGFLFYCSISLFIILEFILRNKLLVWLSLMKNILITFSFLFTLYLIGYQHFVVKAFCPLCLTSSITIFTMFLTIIFFRKEKKEKNRSQINLKELFIYLFISLFMALVLIGDMIFINEIGMGKVKDDKIVEIIHKSMPQVISQKWLKQMAPCSFRRDIKKIDNIESKVIKDYPYLGSENFKYTVLYFFDPNCPKCKKMHEVLVKVIPEMNDNIRIFMIPSIIHESSQLSIEAMLIAKSYGKLYEMIDLIFKISEDKLIDKIEILKLAVQLGLDKEEFRKKLESHETLKELKELKKYSSELNVEETPTLIINGRYVANSYGNISIDCVRNLIAEEILIDLQ